jgi:hypothetical protein
MTTHESQLPNDFVARQYHKVERFVSTGEIQSEFAIVGSIPDVDAVSTPPEKDIYYECGLVVGEHGEAMELSVGDEAVAQEVEAVLGYEAARTALGPLVALAFRDYVDRMGLAPDVRLQTRVGWINSTVEAGADDDITQPHLDGEQDDPLGGVFYIATVGAPTNVWEGVFMLGEAAQPPDGAWLEPAELLGKQIHDQGLMPAAIPRNSLICLDSQTVHASPEAEPEVAGTERTLVTIHFSQVKTGGLVQ